jgi:hypothetical protein
MLLLPAFVVDVGMFMLGGSAIYGQAAITSAAFVLVGIALWLSYLRFVAAIWIGAAATVAALAAVAFDAATLGSEPNALWIIVAILAVTAVVVVLLLTRPDARAYFEKG